MHENVREQFWDYLPGGATNILKDNYSNYIQKSDTDFSIYIDPKLSNFNKHF